MNITFWRKIEEECEPRYHYHIAFAVCYQNGCFDFQSAKICVKEKIDFKNSAVIFQEAFVSCCSASGKVKAATVLGFDLLGEELVPATPQVPEQTRNEEKEGENDDK